MSLLRIRPVARQLVSASSKRWASAAPAITVTSTRSNASAPALANIEASWKDLPADEQYEVYQQLEELQKKDWKELTIDEKKAAYFVAFGPHGPRAPSAPPGQNMRVFAGTIAGVAAAIGLFAFVRSRAPAPIPTMTKEYQEATGEYMKTQNMNPIHGISSEGYQGKGMVTVE